jgi:ankyrin repeat protein
LCGDLDIVRFLAVHNVNAGDIEVDCRAAIHCADNEGHLDVAKYLVEEQDMDSEALVKMGEQNTIHLSASEGRFDVVEYLIEEQDFGIYEPCSDDDTPYHLAATMRWFQHALCHQRERSNYL